MKSGFVKKEIELSIWEEDDKVALIEIEFKYYRTTYGDDIDGNRGIPVIEMGKHKISVPKTREDNVNITKEEDSELYKEAFSTMMAEWETWVEEEEDYDYDDKY